MIAANIMVSDAMSLLLICLCQYLLALWPKKKKRILFAFADVVLLGERNNGKQKRMHVVCGVSALCPPVLNIYFFCALLRRCPGCVDHFAAPPYTPLSLSLSL